MTTSDSRSAGNAKNDREQQDACPRCGSVAVEETFSHTAVLGFLTIWPFLPVRRRWACTQCGHSWKRFRW